MGKNKIKWETWDSVTPLGEASGDYLYACGITNHSGESLTYDKDVDEEWVLDDIVLMLNSQPDMLKALLKIKKSYTGIDNHEVIGRRIEKLIPIIDAAILLATPSPDEKTGI